MKEYKFERLISFVLAVAMVFTLLPTNALAAGFSRRGNAVVAEGEETSTTVSESPATEQPKTEAPTTEQPKTEAPAAEQPKTEAPAAEQPKTEVPTTEEPKTEPSNPSEEKTVTIKYEVKGGGGSVSPDSETIKETSGDAKGAKATAAEGYEFKEWQTASGTKVGGNASFTPNKSDGAYKEATYYAVFDKAAESEAESLEEAAKKLAKDAEKMAQAAMDELQKSKQAVADAAAEAEAARKALEEADANPDLTPEERQALEQAKIDAEEKAKKLAEDEALADEVMLNATKRWDEAEKKAAEAEAAADQKALEDAKSDLGQDAILYLVKFIDSLTNKVLKRTVVAAGDSVTPPEAPEHDGYVFYGWDPEDMDAISADASFSAAYVSEEELNGFPMMTLALAAPGGDMEDASYITYTFKVGETTIDTQIVTTGDTLVDPGTPSAEGQQEFLGWYNGETKFTDFGTVGTVDANESITLTAKFQEVYYVFFHNETGAVIETRSGANAESISTANVNALELKADEALAGWSTSNGGNTDVGASVTINGANIDLYPIVTSVIWVSFDSDGGTYVPPFSMNPGTTLTQAMVSSHIAANADGGAVTKAGYTLSDWTGFTLGQAPTQNVTLKANWTAKADTQYTVAYWLENAMDNGYTFKESVVRTGATGAAITNSMLQQKSYTNYTYSSNDASGKTIAGDGSTVVNMYYKRNTFTLTFQVQARKNWTTIFTHTAKFGSDVTSIFPIKGTNGTTYTGRAWEATSYYNYALQTLDIMPAQNVTFRLYDQSSNTLKTIYYYGESLSGSGWDLLKTVTTYFNYMTYEEEYHNIDGFSRWSASAAGFYNSKKDFDRDNTAKLYYDRNSYNLIFRNTDNSGIKTESVKYQAPLSGYAGYTPARPSGVPSTFVFKGWYTDNKGTAGTEFNFNSTMPAGDQIIYAIWSAPTFNGTAYLKVYGSSENLTFDIGEIPYGGTIDSNKLSAARAKVEEYKPSSSSVFGGWLISRNGALVAFNASERIYSNVTLYPNWIGGAVFTVTYAAGEGSGTVPLDSASYASGSYAKVLSAETLTAPTGKVFAGWKSSTDNAICFPNGKVLITGNTTLTAQWVDPAQMVTITYNSNYPKGSSETLTSNPQANNTKYSIIACPADWSAENYEFTGWNTQADGSGKAYKAGDEITLGLAAGSTTLFAQWAKQNYKVTYYPSYEPNNGNRVFSYAADAFSSSYPVVKNYNDADIGFVREGYRFLGWSLRNDGGAARPVDFDPGDVLELSDFNGKSIGLYAVWSQELTVSYQYTGTVPTGAPAVPASSTAIAGENVTVKPAPTLNGYVFSGWTIATPATGVAISGGKFTMPETNVVLTGSWKQNTYTLTINYVYEDNTTAAPTYTETLTVGDPYTVVSPAITGYTPDKASVAGSMGEANVTVTVIYTANNYDVTYAPGAADVTGMPETNPVSVNYKESHTVAAAPTRAGYDFAGWATSDVTGANEIYGTTGAASFTMPANDVTLTAQWTEKSKVTIYYQANDAAMGSVSEASEALNPEIGTAAGSTATANTGYHFVNWTLDGAAVSTDASFVPARPATGWKNGMTFVANFAANTNTAYTVEHYKQELGKDTYALADTENLTGTTGAGVSATAKTYTGYTYDSTIAGTVVNGTIAADGSLVLKLYYKLNSHKVTYSYTNTVPGASTLPAEATYQYNAPVSIAAPATAEGYAFSGWQIGSSAAANFNMPDADVAITGSFTAIDYTLTYDDGVDDASVSGMPTGSPFTQHIADSITVAAAPTRAGYTFKGWEADQAISGTTAFDPDATFAMPARNVTLTAQWEAIDYTVTYRYAGTVPAGATALPTAATGKHIGDEITVAAAATAEGYTFSGWTIVDPATGAPVVNNGKFTMPAGSVILEGSFTVNSYAYTVELYKYTTDQATAEKFGSTTGKAAAFGTVIIGSTTGYTAGSAAEAAYTGIAPIPAGYTYDSNSDNVTVGVTEASNVLKVYFKANTVGYKVEYYLEKLGETGVYDLDSAATENLSGQVDTTAAYTENSFDGFALSKTTWQYGAGTASTTALTLDADGSLVIKLYYDRNDVNYTVLYYVDNVLQNGHNGTTDWTETGSAEFGADLTAVTPADKCPATHYLADTTYDSAVVTPDAAKNVIRVYYAEKGSILVTFSDSTVPYDGTAHTLTPVISGLNGLTAQDLHLGVTFDGTASTNEVNVKRSGSSVAAYVGTLTGDESYTDASGKVYSVTYSSKTANLTINPVAISVTAKSDEKFYNGTALTNAGYDVVGAFVGSEGFDSVTVTGSVTDVKDSPKANAVTAYTFKTGTLAGNYNVITVPGTLTIKPVSPTVTVTFDKDQYNPGQTANIHWTATGVSGTALTSVDGDVEIVVTLGGAVLANGTFTNPTASDLTVNIPDDADVTQELKATITFTPKMDPKSNYTAANASDTAALTARGTFSVSLADLTVNYNGYEQTLAAPALNGAPTGVSFNDLGLTVDGGKGTSYGRYPASFKKDGSSVTAIRFTKDGTLYDVTLTGATLTVQPKLSYNGNGNTAGTAPADAYGAYQLATTSFTATVAAAGSLVKTGYTFEGWATDEDATTADYAAGTTIALAANETTLYAVWKAVDYKVSYTFTGTAPVGGFPTPPLETTQNHVGDSITRAANASVAGYTFSGWTASPAVTVDADGKFTMPASNVVFTGSFTAVDYTVTYAYDTTAPANASKLPTGETAKHIGDSITVAADATSASHNFLGWVASYVDGSGNTQTIAISGDPKTFTMPAANVTITGSFSIKTYTVTFMAAAGGSITNDADDGAADSRFVTTVDYGTAFSAVTKGVAAADSTHYFTGWTPAFPADAAEVTDNLTFEAQFASKKALSFTAATDTVTYDGKSHTLPITVSVNGVAVTDEAAKAAFIAAANVTIDSKTDAGTYPLTPAGNTTDVVVDGVTYTTAYTGADLVIEKRPTATTVSAGTADYYTTDMLKVTGSVTDVLDAANWTPDGKVKLTITGTSLEKEVDLASDGTFSCDTFGADALKNLGSFTVNAEYLGTDVFKTSANTTTYTVRAFIPYTIRYEFETLTAGSYEERPDLVAGTWPMGGTGKLSARIDAPTGWEALSPAGFVASAANSTTSIMLADITTELNNNELVLRFNRERITVTFQPGAHGSLAGAGADGNVRFEVISGAAMPQAPDVNPASHYYHIDWSPVYDANATVTGNLVFTAQYGEMVRMTVQFRILGTSTAIRTNAVTWYMPNDLYDYSSGTATARHYRIAGYTYNSSRGDFTTRFTAAEAGVAEGKGRVVTLYYVLNTTSPTPSSTPTNTPSPNITNTPTTVPTAEVTDNPVPLMTDNETPLAAPQRAWALLNLILMLLTALASILMLVGYLGKNKKEEQNGKLGELKMYDVKKHGFMRFISLVPAIGAVIAFILTEDMRLPMVFTDQWTLLMVAIAIIQAGVALLAKRDREEEENPETQH